MERIEINGVWYVREDSTPKTQPEDSIHIDATMSQHLIFETDECCFNVHRIYRDDEETFYDDVSIEFTDKRPTNREDWKTEYWDNDRWLIGVLQNDEISLREARESLSEKGISELKYVIRQLIERGWIINF
jgi:hypothetical protein